jgi:predicted RNase H-like nuclease (RuvC/YqgF family)
MDLDTARREVEKQAELSKMKNRDIEQLTDRNYELEEKIRQKDFRVAQRVEPTVTRNNSEDIFQLQEESRRKDIEISRLKADNEELNRNIRRETEELESLKIKYPSRLKIQEEELQDLRLKTATLEKKYAAADSRARELEEALKRTKVSAVEEQSSEATKIREHFSKLVERLEEDNRSVKEKIRAYELKVHDLEIENNSLEGRNKELETFKDEHAKRLISLSERLEEKEG